MSHASSQLCGRESSETGLIGFMSKSAHHLPIGYVTLKSADSETGDVRSSVLVCRIVKFDRPLKTASMT